MLLFWFLVADYRLYKRLCPSVHLLVHSSVSPWWLGWKSAFPPLPTRPGLVLAVYPTLLLIRTFLSKMNLGNEKIVILMRCCGGIEGFDEPLELPVGVNDKWICEGMFVWRYSAILVALRYRGSEFWLLLSYDRSYDLWRLLSKRRQGVWQRLIQCYCYAYSSLKYL